jgi:hypothetical protein
MSRPVEVRYDDPLALIWRRTAERLGMRLVTSEAIHASWDGAGTLSLGAGADLDADDCPAQLVLHELCHALVEGPQAFSRPDWGLCNRDDRDLPREHACHRLQAALADRHGLRHMLAPTTEHRTYYDGLPADPLAPGDDPAIGPAREGFARASQDPWAEALEQALAATSALARTLAPFAGPGSLWSRAALR